MATADFHPELRAARYLPRSIVGPRRLRLIRRLIALRKPDPGANAVATNAGPQVPVRMFLPDKASRRHPGLLWLHGGGMVLDTTAMEDATCRAFADRLGIVVASVSYRLAPEHPYPTPLEDCYTALRWLAALPDVDADRIAVGGASAGGGLAAALALLARERGEIHPVMQLLVCPMLDDRTSADTDANRRRLRLWNHADNRFGWNCYLGPAAAGPVPPLAAPARHDDLAGLPRAWIGVGTHDLFHDEDIAYGHRLRQAGVACTVDVVPGAYHCFDRIEAQTPVAQAFFDAQVAALDATLNDERSSS
jgi:acetyl esterase/lipase